MKPLCNQPGLIPIGSLSTVMLEPKHPLTTNQILRWRGWNQNPGTLPLEHCKFIIHYRTPLRVLCRNPIGWWFCNNVIRLRSRTDFLGFSTLHCRIAELKWNINTLSSNWIGWAWGRWYCSSYWWNSYSLGNKGFGLEIPSLDLVIIG